MPLPNMTGVCILGTYGVSTHAGGLVRLWDATNGRRLAASQLKLELSAVAGAGTIVAVADVAGAVYLYCTEADFSPYRITAPVAASTPRAAAASGATIASLALVTLEGDGAPLLVVASSIDGGVPSGSLVHTEPWPPTQATKVALPASMGSATPPPGGAVGLQHLLAGPHGHIFTAADGTVASHDLGAASCASSRSVGNTQSAAAGWHGTCPGMDQLADRLASVALDLSAAAASSGSASASTVPTSLATTTRVLPYRPISYSPTWHLLAAPVGDSPMIALWDTRTRSDHGPAAALRLAAGDSASWLHLDESDSLAGQLLVASSNETIVRVFDIRRVPCTRTSSALQAVTSVQAPASASAVCFAAQGSSLIVGGGAKCSTSWRYNGERADLSTEADDDDDEKANRKPGKEKKKRLAKKEQIGSRQSRCA